MITIVNSVKHIIILCLIFICQYKCQDFKKPEVRKQQNTLKYHCKILLLIFYKVIDRKQIDLTQYEEYIVIQIDGLQRNLILGWVEDIEQIPTTMEELLKTGQRFDVNCNQFLFEIFFEHSYHQVKHKKCTYKKVKFLKFLMQFRLQTVLNQIDMLQLLTQIRTLNKNIILKLMLNLKVNQIRQIFYQLSTYLENKSCWCEDLKINTNICQCEGHGVVKCLNNFIGSRCEQQSKLLELQEQIYTIRNSDIFYFDTLESDMLYVLEIKGIDPNIDFQLLVKYYVENSSFLPYTQNSSLQKTINNYKLKITPNQPYEGQPLYNNRIVLKIQYLNIPNFDVVINLSLSGGEREDNENTIIIIVLIAVSVFILIILFLAVLYIVKLQKKDRQLAEQNRLQRIVKHFIKFYFFFFIFLKRNQQRMNTTMGDEDLKKFMPAILYKQIKEKLFKISKQEDVGTCVVCLCDFEDEEKIRSTYCKHVFHSDCLTDWMKKNESCPYCRTALNKDNIAEIYNKYQSNSLMWLESDDLKQSDSKRQNEQEVTAQQINNEQINVDNQEQNQIYIESRNLHNPENQNEIVINQQIIQNSNQATIEIPRRGSYKSQNQNQQTQIKQSTMLTQNNPLQIKLIGAQNKQPRNENYDFSSDKEKENQLKSTLQRIQEDNDISIQQNEQNINIQQKDYSIVENRGVNSTQLNDNSFIEILAYSQRNNVINQTRKTSLLNESQKNQNTFNDQSYIHDIKNLNNSQFGQDISVDLRQQNNYAHNMNDEVERINVENIQSEGLHHTKENEEYNNPKRKADNGLKIVFGDNIALEKIFKQSPNSSLRQTQIINPKRRVNKKKTSNYIQPQSLNASVNGITKQENNIV